MVAVITKSNVLSMVKEDVEGTLKAEAVNSDFIPLRAGYSMSGAINTVDSDEFIAGDIGASKSFTTDEAPTASIPLYLRGSGVEGQEPEIGKLFEGVLGSKTINATEYDLIAGSTVSVLKLDSGEGTNFKIGQAVLVKDSANDWSVRMVKSINGDDLHLNFDLPAAPAIGVKLGKAINYAPGLDHPSFSVHRYQSASAGSAFKDSMTGAKVNSLGLTFAANGLGEGTAEMTGLGYYWNPITIDNTNNKIDFNDGSVRVATLTNKVYKTPIALAEEIALKMDAVATNTVSCVYSNETGKFTISVNTGTLTLLCDSGANKLADVFETIGFATTADKSGATEYTSDAGITFIPSVVPSYDTSDSVVIKGAQFLIGDKNRISCRKASNIEFSIETTVNRVPSVCADTGIDSTVATERSVSLSGTLILSKYEAELMDKFFNNSTTQVQFTAGAKSSAQWKVGETFTVALANASITAHTVAESDGYHIVNLEAKAFVNSDISDCYINFL